MAIIPLLAERLDPHEVRSLISGITSA